MRVTIAVIRAAEIVLIATQASLLNPLRLSPASVFEGYSFEDIFLKMFTKQKGSDERCPKCKFKFGLRSSLENQPSAAFACLFGWGTTRK